MHKSAYFPDNPLPYLFFVKLLLSANNSAVQISFPYLSSNFWRHPLRPIFRLFDVRSTGLSIRLFLKFFNCYRKFGGVKNVPWIGCSFGNCSYGTFCPSASNTSGIFFLSVNNLYNYLFWGKGKTNFEVELIGKMITREKDIHTERTCFYSSGETNPTNRKNRKSKIHTTVWGSLLHWQLIGYYTLSITPIKEK